MIHEVAHGWVAYRLGDSTAKDSGRLSLNPVRHIDPVGTIILPALLIATNSPVVFGWAKPVPINFLNLKHIRRDSILVSLSGISANILLAALLSLIMKTGIYPENSYGSMILNVGIIVNLILAVFNAIPIPPLDGSHILMGLLPSRMARRFARIQPYGFFILFFLLYVGLVNRVIWPIVAFLYYALTK